MLIKYKLIFGFTLLCGICFAQQKMTDGYWGYPYIKPDTIVDNYFGNKIVDEYRNIENIEDEEVKIWYKAQKRFYDSILNNISYRDTLKKEIRTYKDIRAFWSELPRCIGNRCYFSRYNYEKRIHILCYSDNVNDTIIELFSLDSISKADSIRYRIRYFEPSNDGAFIALALSSWKDENSSLYIFDVKQRKLLPDRIDNVRTGNPQWLPDNSGFIYQSYLLKKRKDNGKTREVSIKLHKLGTSSMLDKTVFSRELCSQIEVHEIDFPLMFLSQNSSNVLLCLNHGTEENSALYFVDINEVLKLKAEKVNWKQIFSHDDLVTNYYVNGNTLYYLSFKNNSTGQVLRKNLINGKSVVLLDSDSTVFSDMVLNRNSIYVKSHQMGICYLTKIDIENEKIEEVNLPDKGTIFIRPSFKVSDFYQNSDKLFFKYHSWNRDQCIFYIDTISSKFVQTELIPVTDKNYLSDIKIEIKRIRSYDSTIVPLTIYYKEGLKKNGDNPLIIEAYGCYGYTYSPNYNAARRVWLERGGMYAVAHVRGGGELGEDWYRAGHKENKPNSWKDLISCTEYLINKKYTAPDKTSVIGTSCGAIAAGRAITERPELFKAAVISVGMLNTMRHEQEMSQSNRAEYGTVTDSNDIKSIYEMDVYHHIKENVQYPSLLITSGMNDSRVSAWHGGKSVAKFQKNDSKSNIVLYYISDGAHTRFSESSDSYTFLFWQIGHQDFKLKKCFK